MNEVIEWLNGYYGKLTIVLVNQNSHIDNGVGGWTDDSPGSYSDNLSNTEGEAVGVHVEYAYLANNPAFNVTTSVLYSSDATPVSAAVLTGSPAEPHSNIADYTFTVGFVNAKDSSSNQPYYLRIVDSMEAEILHKGNTGDYETVRTVELPVGSSTKLTFLKADSAESGWYKVVYRYTVNGKTTETVVAEDIYLDNTCSIEPSVRTYTRTFDLYVRQPEWRYGTYYVSYTKYTHLPQTAH